MKVNLKEALAKARRKLPFKALAEKVRQKAKEPGFYKNTLLNRRFVFPAIGFFFVILFLISFIKDHISCVGGFPVYQKTKKRSADKALEEIPIQVKVYKVARVNFRDTLPALATIKGFREFDLKFPVPGVVEYVNFKEGEKITQGDIVASLDQKEALLKLEYTRLEMEKQTKLFELGSVVEIKLQQAQLEYQSAKAEFEKTNLVALSDGYVGSLEADRGSYVTPQDKMGTFVDVKDVYAEFGIIEKDVAKVRAGQNVELAVESYSDQMFKGEVDSISPLVEGRSRTLEVRSKISNVDEKLKPGMFGRVNVLIYEKDDALVIPSSSFRKKEDQYFVYLVHEEDPKPADEGEKKQTEEPQTTFGALEIRPIEIQYATPDAIEIKEGLEEGDLVIMDLEQELQDKAKVEITEVQEGIF